MADKKTLQLNKKNTKSELEIRAGDESIAVGGSWIGYQWFARSSFCNWSIPLMFNDDLGFRVVIAPKDS